MESLNRSIIKAITWRFIATVVLGIIVLILTNNVVLAFGLSIIDVFAKIALYFLHERIWARIKFGKLPGITLWFTGRSGAGKTTIGNIVIAQLTGKGYNVQTLDGDIVRSVVDNRDFSPEGRKRHLKYMALFTKLFNLRGITTLCTFITPSSETRAFLRNTVPNLYLVHIKCGLEEAKKRDRKGLYQKNTPGIDYYEEPDDADLIIDTEQNDVSESANQIFRYFNKIKSGNSKDK